MTIRNEHCLRVCFSFSCFPAECSRCVIAAFSTGIRYIHKYIHVYTYIHTVHVHSAFCAVCTVHRVLCLYVSGCSGATLPDWHLWTSNWLPQTTRTYVCTWLGLIPSLAYTLAKLRRRYCAKLRLKSNQLHVNTSPKRGTNYFCTTQLKFIWQCAVGNFETTVCGQSTVGPNTFRSIPAISPPNVSNCASSFQNGWQNCYCMYIHVLCIVKLKFWLKCIIITVSVFPTAVVHVHCPARLCPFHQMEQAPREPCCTPRSLWQRGQNYMH